jgi:hypothetical protein
MRLKCASGLTLSRHHASSEPAMGPAGATSPSRRKGCRVRADARQATRAAAGAIMRMAAVVAAAVGASGKGGLATAADASSV